jgi:hypothetical protein
MAALFFLPDSASLKVMAFGTGWCTMVRSQMILTMGPASRNGRQAGSTDLYFVESDDWVHQDQRRLR